MSFLKSEVQNEERINMAVQGFNLEESIKGAKPQKTGSASLNRRAIPMTAGLVNCKSGKVFCVFVKDCTLTSPAKRHRVSASRRRDI
jgi:hypothetical protein